MFYENIDLVINSTIISTIKCKFIYYEHKLDNIYIKKTGNFEGKSYVAS